MTRQAEAPPTCTGELVEVNSGGVVLFCFFAAQRSAAHTAQGRSTPQPSPREGCCVVKFSASRLTTQSEQFANELMRHLGVCAPACRILRKGGAPSLHACMVTCLHVLCSVRECCGQVTPAEQRLPLLVRGMPGLPPAATPSGTRPASRRHPTPLAQGATAAEWREASSAALLLGSRGEALAEAMAQSAACLVMDFIPGRPLLSLGAPFDPRRLHRTAADLGRRAPRQPHPPVHASSLQLWLQPAVVWPCPGALRLCASLLCLLLPTTTTL